MKTSKAKFLLLFFLMAGVGHSRLALAQEGLFFKTSDLYEKIRVARVISADTLELSNEEKITLIGLKALPPPEMPEKERDRFGFTIKDEKPYMSEEEQAFHFVKDLLTGRDVRLEFDKQKKDSRFYTLAYVFLVEENIFVNEEILRKGYARLHIKAPNMKYAPVLRSAYQEARKEKRGLHSAF